MDWTDLAEDRQVTDNSLVSSFLNSWETISFSRRAVLLVIVLHYIHNKVYRITQEKSFAVYTNQCFGTQCQQFSVGDEMVHKTCELCESLTFELLHISNTAWGNWCKPQIIYFVYRSRVVIKRRSSWMTSWIERSWCVGF